MSKFASYFSIKINIFLVASLLITTTFMLSSCEREVSFNLGDAQDKIVVEGTIENGQFPIVRFSKSIGFFSKIDLKTFSESFLHDAVMTVSDGSKSVALKEYALTFDSLSFFIYSIDTADVNALLFKGEVGKSYDLKIEYKGKTYTSTTTIPELVPLDSVWAQAPPVDEIPEEHPNVMEIFARYTDPPTRGNKARYFTSTNGGQFLSPLYSVYDDDVVNGTTVDITLSAGMNRMDSLDFTTYGYVLKGDTVILKWCNIDDQTFSFWRTLEYSYGANGNPFASPVKISTNISNGALGIWQGYASSYDTLYVPH